MTSQPLRIVRLFPDLLGTYGDDGNATVLHARAIWRGLPATIVDVTAADGVPDDGAIYVIGGGEDGPQATAAERLDDSGALHRAIDRGAAVLAVCAGFQLLGHDYLGPDGTSTPGLGLLDVHTGRGTGARIVGEVVADPDPALGLAQLTGYENHAGITTLGSTATPLARVRIGVGNGCGDGTEGAWQGRIAATYLHGPVLARNPSLADLLLCWALDVEPGSLTELDDQRVEALRHTRFAAAQANTEHARAGRVRRLMGGALRRVRAGA